MNLFRAVRHSPPIRLAMLRSFPTRTQEVPALKRSSDASDVALVERVAVGDVRAFENLYRSYHHRLMRFLGLMTSRRTVVEEALNDAMLVVWKRSHTYNRQSKVSTWIFAIAYRTALKLLRAQDEPVDPPADELSSEDPGPEQQLSASQTRSELLRGLDDLSPEQRCALVFAYFHDLSYGEIASIMNCPVDTVKTRVFHGRRRLRALLDDGAREAR
jgi:RNA polymerase sigma-70 factor (ECF subfamily)